MRLRSILRVMTRMRDVHPEMAEPVTWDGLKRIITREGVLIVTESLSMPAQLIGIPGQWAIVLNRDEPKRRWPYFAAHELGHLKLHVDQLIGRFEPCFHMERDWGHDPREDDAEFFATALLMGPRQAVRGAMVLRAEIARKRQLETEMKLADRMQRRNDLYDQTVTQIMFAKSHDELDTLERLVADRGTRRTQRRLMGMIVERRAELETSLGKELWAMLQERSGKPSARSSVSGTLRH